ncbi:5-methyltetrahydropteroyltriglutamate--homocysteine S-methyltransferase [Buchnera aphidicola (Thelaxes californica)]|uniref:5-methyltetrahydropteroyltriglutamate--homocysteine methyltransferase n=1 Tax=Buchnera aphidicola (Thelaxes californica) TaxID=1315998 RepID=A0A4D6YNG5_9GAMM|nr:5-methyltetrahydropteroyltriglutamate--homocysteine S-methyltransferase [Buchnera aphidicola]QCI26585.1 5-methyltetrahydropteroyltriglutamate--homocysteine S-methyltransferase [Buchnera aphidicola (Thelaxes californica)]
MNISNTILGYPRIGINRELKQAQEKYWAKKISQTELFKIGKKLRKTHWEQQIKLGIDLIPVGDFAWYDHVLSTTMMLGNIPKRHQYNNHIINIDTLFRIARGTAPTGPKTSASEMTKWFNTNYHYIVPEFIKNNTFQYQWTQLIDELDEAISYGYKAKPIVLGPLSYLWLGKIKGKHFDKLELLNNILPIYQLLLEKIKKRNIDWVQIDEPILSLDLPESWLNAFFYTYNFFNKNNKNNIILTTYFGDITHNFETIVNLPIQGLHLDLINCKSELYTLHKKIPKDWLLSLGIINGRNIWKSDLIYWFQKIKKIYNERKKIFLSSSCSLLHCPIDVQYEKKINTEIKKWFAFSVQKCHELFLLKNALKEDNIEKLVSWTQPIIERHQSNIVNDTNVQNRIKKNVLCIPKRYNKYYIRSLEQKKLLNLPILPTTTIGSFPQTNALRKIRMDFKNSKINQNIYNNEIKKIIKKNIEEQEKLGLDVLVHGEPERNDMVEYFGENLNGFTFTENGWVQSYGSRCVKPPIIIGDVSRKKDITVKLTKYAQSLTKKPIKGMLTGPVTILQWSFPREDISKEKIATQLALSLQDEVLELEKSGINIIQIDEPALREGLPLIKKEWEPYLKWAINAFKLSYYGVKDSTQIHTHMCYCEFNDFMNAITQLDADVITIETSRSDMELLEIFKKFQYPNEIGPGVYDIHSPNIPTIECIEQLLKKAINCIDINRLWVNPDCGLKTRSWDETKLSIKAMIQAAINIRNKL